MDELSYQKSAYEKEESGRKSSCLTTRSKLVHEQVQEAYSRTKEISVYLYFGNTLSCWSIACRSIYINTIENIS